MIEPDLSHITSNWVEYWPGLDVGPIAADVAGRFADACDGWGLTDEVSLEGGNVALVSAASKRGERVVVKVNPRGTPDDAQLRAEAPALAHWCETGAAATLLASRDDGMTLLLERVDPGDTLDASNLEWERKLEILGELARSLHTASLPPPEAPHMSEYAEYWRQAIGDSQLRDELDHLVAASAVDVLIHADLHPGNALR